MNFTYILHSSPLQLNRIYVLPEAESTDYFRRVGNNPGIIVGIENSLPDMNSGDIQSIHHDLNRYEKMLFVAKRNMHSPGIYTVDSVQKTRLRNADWSFAFCEVGNSGFMKL